MRIAVTGAGGFVGSALVDRLANSGLASGHARPEIVAVDARLPADLATGVVPIEGDLRSADVVDRLLAEPVDIFIHLAAVPGGAAEADYALGWGVNVDATVAILDRLARQPRPARLVFASSIGVFGAPLPSGLVDDDTPARPTMSYGTQKLMMEALVADIARRGLVDGLAVRLPGIIARPRVRGGHLSAYMSDILHALRAGEPFVCPVAATATSWFMSRSRCIDNLLHAAMLPPDSIGTRRAFNLPALRISMQQLVDAAAGHFGEHLRTLVSWKPDAALQAQFGSYPPLATPIADGLGFRNDGDALALVANALDLASALQDRGAA